MTVRNGDGSLSAVFPLVVSVRKPKVFYAAAFRFLEQATWGPTVADVIALQQSGFQVSIKLPIPTDEGRDVATPNELALARFVPMRMKRRGVEMRLIIDGDATTTAHVDLPLKATARAYRWSNDLLAGRARSIAEIARREHLTGRHVRRVMRLAFLAPRIVEAIAEGRQPADLTTLAMIQRIAPANPSALDDVTLTLNHQLALVTIGLRENFQIQSSRTNTRGNYVGENWLRHYRHRFGHVHHGTSREPRGTSRLWRFFGLGSAMGRSGRRCIAAG